jgi:hypothetical protein
MMKLFNRFKRKIGLKNKYAVKEINEGGRLRAAVILTDEEQKTLGRAERAGRFRKWRKEEGL